MMGLGLTLNCEQQRVENTVFIIKYHLCWEDQICDRKQIHNEGKAKIPFKILHKPDDIKILSSCYLFDIQLTPGSGNRG